MVHEVDNPLAIPKLLDLAKVVPDLPIDELKKMLLESFGKSRAKILSNSINDEIKGFMYATIEEFDGRECVFIQVCVINPDQYDRFVGFEMLTRLKVWAKHNGIKKIYFMTHRDPKGFMRKYHFQMYGTVLKMDVEKEQ